MCIRDRYRIGYDKIEGFVTPKDLVMYSEQNVGKLEKVDVRTFEGLDEVDEDSLILDVRKASEYQEGHINGAMNIAHTRLLPRLDEVPEKKKIYVHCQAGGRSAVAAALLQREGHDVVLIDDKFENYRKPQTA